MMRATNCVPDYFPVVSEDERTVCEPYRRLAGRDSVAGLLIESWDNAFSADGDGVALWSAALEWAVRASLRQRPYKIAPDPCLRRQRLRQPNRVRREQSDAVSAIALHR